MKRTARIRLLLCFALFHLFADAAFAGGAVLCVGADDHRAVESQHLSGAGCQEPSSLAATPISTAYAQSSASPTDCTDSPLHTEAELVSSADNGSEIAPATVVALAPFQWQQTPPALLRPSARPPAQEPPIRAHRTTVLIL